MPDFEARFVPGSASLAVKAWTDLTSTKNRLNPQPGNPHTFLLATGALGSTVKIYAVPCDQHTGRHNGAENSANLYDSTKSWIIDSLIGCKVDNITDGSSAVITDNSAIVVVGALSGGINNHWHVKDLYILRYLDSLLDGRLFTFDCIEFPGAPPMITSPANWSSEATITLPAVGHYTFKISRPSGGGIIMHLDFEEGV